MASNWSRFFNQLLFGEEPKNLAEMSTLQQPYLNKEALVGAAIAPGQTGRIHCEGSWWPARCDKPLALLPGTRVRVIGRENITLFVEPIQLYLPAAS